MYSLSSNTRIDLLPDEFLFPRSAVALESSRPLDRDVVSRAIGTVGARGRLQFAEGGRRIVWRPAADLEPGRYEFYVDSLAIADGATSARIPFNFVRTAARIPPNLAVEAFSRLAIERMTTRRLPTFGQASGRYIEVMKAVDRKSGEPVELAFSESGRRINSETVWRRQAEARMRAYGKLHPDLLRQLRGRRRDQRVPVAVWAAGDYELDPEDKPARAPRRPAAPAAARLPRELAAATERLGGLLREMAGAQVTVDELAPVVFARLSVRAIRELSEHPAVARIFLYDPRGQDDLDDSMAIAASGVVHGLGATGNGVRAAVWERGPASTTNLNIADRFDTSGSTSNHSTLVHAIIANTQNNAPNGHAPDADLYSANSYDRAALAWAVRQGCTVINQSFHRSAEQTSAELSFDDVYKDWLILRSPYPTIIQAAGNGDANEYVNHKGFNSINAANHDDTAGALSGTSVSRNPDSPHGDRELPEIAANGTGVTAAGQTNSGTSFASPAVVGAAALLQDEAPLLRSWPEGCRAILLAGAKRNITDGTWWNDVLAGVDAADGTGALNALESFRITQARNRRNGPAAQRGWDVGTLSDSDFGNDRLSTFSYRVRLPSGSIFWTPRRVKVALAWNSKITEFNFLGIRIPLSSELAQDFDLLVFDAGGNRVATSASWDNSYEIAEFTGMPGQEYTIRIRRWSGTGWSWYGLAWTVTGGLLDFAVLDTVLDARLAATARAALERGRS